MNSKSVTYIATIILLFLLPASILASGYSYGAQKGLIPKDLGKVYLGMPFKDFAMEFNLAKADVGDIRFEWLELTIPLDRKNIESVRVRIHGLSQEDKAAMLVSETASDAKDDDDTKRRILVSRIPDNGFVYAMYVTFKKDFDLKSYAIKTYGRDGEVRKADDPYHFFDTQWTKKSSDGLVWLIRAFHEGDNRVLQLLGRIDGTEWGID